MRLLPILAGFAAILGGFATTAVKEGLPNMTSTTRKGIESPSDIIQLFQIGGGSYILDVISENPGPNRHRGNVYPATELARVEVQ